MNRRGRKGRGRSFTAIATLLILFAWQAAVVAGPFHAHTETGPPHVTADADGGATHDHHHAPAAGDPPCVDASSDCGAGHACGHCAPTAACALNDRSGMSPTDNCATRDHAHASGPTSPPFRPPART